MKRLSGQLTTSEFEEKAVSSSLGLAYDRFMRNLCEILKLQILMTLFENILLKHISNIVISHPVNTKIGHAVFQLLK